MRAVLARFRNTEPPLVVTTKITYGAYLVANDIQEGRGHIGIAQSDAVYLSYRRGTSLNPTPHTSLRGIAVLGINPVFAFARRDSDIRSLDELKGRRVGVMHRGTSSEVVVRIVLEQYGLHGDNTQLLAFRIPEGLDALRRSDLDAMIGAIPAESVAAYKELHAIRLIPLEPAVIDDLEVRYPFLRPIDIAPPISLTPAGQYFTVGADAVLICTKDLDDDLVYQITKEFFVAVAALAPTSAFAAAIDTGLAPTTPIPLHRAQPATIGNESC